MNTKVIPFSLDIAKRIQAGEVKGIIKTKNGLTCKIVSYCNGTDFFVERTTEANNIRWCYPYTKDGYFIDGKFNGGTDYDLILEIAEIDRKPIREIKFRGHQTASDTWFYGNYVSYLPKKDSFDPIPPCLICDIVDNNGTKHFVNPFTVGQFTGLHDKNGKEIYEGDIVRYVKGQVKGANGEWEDDAVVFVVKYEEASFTISYYARVTGSLEVIGNTHDNPELLEER